MFNDIVDIFGSDWEVVDFIGKFVVGLNCGDVGVDEYRSDISFF